MPRVILICNWAREPRNPPWTEQDNSQLHWTHFCYPLSILSSVILMQSCMGQSRLRKLEALHWDSFCSPPGVWMSISASKGHPVCTPPGSSFRSLSLCLVLNSSRISVPNSDPSLLSSNWWEVSHSHGFRGNLLQEMLPEARICYSGTSCSS